MSNITVDSNGKQSAGAEYDDPRYTFSKTIHERGQISREWFKDGKRHRDDDQHAYEHAGRLQWFKNGIIHRDYDLPAYKWVSGRRRDDSDAFFTQGLLHRLTGPAKISSPFGEEIGRPLRTRSAYKALYSPILDSLKEINNLDGHALYDIEVTKCEFDLIKQFAVEKEIPLYAAWMVEMNIAAKKDILQLFKDNSNSSLPLAWICKALNVTDAAIDNTREQRLYFFTIPSGDHRYEDSRTAIQALSDVVEWDNTHYFARSYVG